MSIDYRHTIEIDEALCVACGLCCRSCSTGVLRLTDGKPQLGGKIACIACGHCVAACPKGAIALDGRGAVTPPEDAFENYFLARRSIRKFADEAPPKDIVQKALDTAAYAPSGKNRHMNRWSVIYGKERTNAVSDFALNWCRQTGESPELLRLAEKGLDLLTCGAPLVIIGWSPDKALNPCVDTVIAMHTVEMMLNRAGYGSCWGGYLRQIAGRCPEFKEMLGVPEGSSIQCCLMVGKAKGEHYPNIPPRPAAEPYWV